MQIKFTVEMISLEVPDAFEDLSLDEMRMNLASYLKDDFGKDLDSINVKAEVIE